MHHLLRSQTLVTQRDLFYKVMHHGFRSQQELNDIVLDMAALLEVPRIELGIGASSKGFVGGHLQWRHRSTTTQYFEDESWFDVSQHEFGVPISGTVSWTEFDVRSDARYILVVEKEGIYHRLMEDCFWRMIPAIVLTGCGFPDLSTRMLLHRLHSVLHIPVLCLVDYNPFGYQIFSTYAFGSARMGMETMHFALPHTQWLGMRHDDTEKIPSAQRQPFTMLDDQRMNELIDETVKRRAAVECGSDCTEDYLEELLLMSRGKYKVELQALYHAQETPFSSFVCGLVFERCPAIAREDSKQGERDPRNSL